MPQPWDLAGSFQGARLNQQKIDTGDVDAAGQAAAGRALMSMMPGAQPMPQAGGPPPNAMGMPQNPMQRLQSLFQSPQAPQPAAGAPAPQGGMAQAPMPGAQPMPMQAPQMNVPGGGMPQGMPANGMPPGMPGQPPMGGGAQPGGIPQPGGAPMGGQPQPGGMGGGMPSLDWRTIIQQVVKANPDVKDPRVLAAAVDKFMPIMNSQSLMEWRQLTAGIRGFQAENQAANIQSNIQHRGTMEQQAGQRISDAEAAQRWRQEHGDTMAAQGQERIDQGGKRIEIAEKRESRLAGSAKVREDQRFQQLELQRKALESRITQGNQRQLLGQWRALLDAQHKRAQEIIQSAAAGGMPMDPKERKQLLDEENTRYEDAIRQMRSGGATGASFNERFAPSGQPPQQGAGPVRVKTREEAEKLSKGTHYITPDGQEFTR